MYKSVESINDLVAALHNAQKKMGAATKGSSNPYFKSKYADYGSVLEACKDLLNENGITILQPHVHQDGKNFVETLLVHSSGQWLSSLTEIVCAKPNDPQALGSAITYARRYGLQSLLSMPAEDDDGEAAQGRKSATVTKLPTAPKPTVVKEETKPSTGGSFYQGKPKTAPVAEKAPDVDPFG